MHSLELKLTESPILSLVCCVILGKHFPSLVSPDKQPTKLKLSWRSNGGGAECPARESGCLGLILAGGQGRILLALCLSFPICKVGGNIDSLHSTTLGLNN